MNGMPQRRRKRRNSWVEKAIGHAARVSRRNAQPAFCQKADIEINTNNYTTHEQISASAVKRTAHKKPRQSIAPLRYHE